jgi:hypothetical protein
MLIPLDATTPENGPTEVRAAPPLPLPPGTACPGGACLLPRGPGRGGGAGLRLIAGAAPRRSSSWAATGGPWRRSWRRGSRCGSRRRWRGRGDAAPFLLITLLSPSYYGAPWVVLRDAAGGATGGRRALQRPHAAPRPRQPHRRRPRCNPPTPPPAPRPMGAPKGFREYAINQAAPCFGSAPCVGFGFPISSRTPAVCLGAAAASPRCRSHPPHRSHRRRRCL